MEIHLNITFPRIPCELLTLDVMDVSGEQQTGVMHGVSKVRLGPLSEGSHVIESTALDLSVSPAFLTLYDTNVFYRHAADDKATHLDPDYCGGCYGAPSPQNAQKAGCCNTCEEVREAYASVSWAFGKGENVQQCEREGYAERLDSQRKEGCRIEGGIRVNKVIGNFHIAPGRSFSNGNMHVHDLNNYFENPAEHGHTFTHTIHHLRFGPQLPESVTKKLGAKALPWTNHHLNPLDETQQLTDDPAFNYMYFVKVVSTSYLPLGWERGQSTGLFGGGSEIPHDILPIGSHGYGLDGSVEAHQYSVTSHKRSLGGGSDAKEGHKERLHAQGGIPGVFFSYVSPPNYVLLALLLFTNTWSGYISYEGHQPRRADKNFRRLPDGCLRRYRRHADRRRRDRSWGLRRGVESEKNSSAMILVPCLVRVLCTITFVDAVK